MVVLFGDAAYISIVGVMGWSPKFGFMYIACKPPIDYVLDRVVRIVWVVWVAQK